eukprot:Plantae.Rhodophyta-Hildenbrandia_rubra.ctg1883.p1 GENE.Plantae.Rhodophyta-Hildenbrandia_rubra.ctg1883~~Plantae.Rhodophyta-Hildenbrandia_rubra.ctg1883.p1  ORF type:complete len:250 (+),score=22.80 Plantae.Rhodophyta-Hildenbrandia_rubra.ctg1883:1484-2233(+)
MADTRIVRLRHVRAKPFSRPFSLRVVTVAHVRLTSRLIIREEDPVIHCRVRETLTATDRGNFVHDIVHKDEPRPVGWGSLIQAPSIHAVLLQHVSKWLAPSNRVLDVGCGVGYMTVCLAQLVQGDGGRVLGIDHVQQVVQMAKDVVAKSYPDLVDDGTVEFECRDARMPWDCAKFDAIIVSAAVREVPMHLRDKLKSLGRMLIPITRPNQPGVQDLYCLDKRGRRISNFSIVAENVSFPPLCGLNAQLE